MRSKNRVSSRRAPHVTMTLPQPLRRPPQGLYQLDFTYSGNETSSGGADVISAQIVSTKGLDIDEYLAKGSNVSGKSRVIVNVAKAQKARIDVS